MNITYEDVVVSSAKRFFRVGRIWEIQLRNQNSLVIYPLSGVVKTRCFSFEWKDGSMIKFLSLLMPLRPEYMCKMDSATKIKICECLN